MSAARRGGGGPPANAALRGGILIVVAVLVGALLLSRGFADEGGLVAAPDNSTGTGDTDDSDDTTDPGDTDTGEGEGDGTGEGDGGEGDGGEVDGGEEPAPTARPNEEVKFTVINGTTSNGAAGRMATQLSALNYVQIATGNVPGGGGADVSAIYYVEGWQLEAQTMATNLAVDPALAVPMPPPFEIDPGDAVIVVVLGRDGLISA